MYLTLHIIHSSQAYNSAAVRTPQSYAFDFRTCTSLQAETLHPLVFTLHPPSQHPSFPAPGNHGFFCVCRFAYSDISYKWNLSHTWLVIGSLHLTCFQGSSIHVVTYRITSFYDKFIFHYYTSNRLLIPSSVDGYLSFSTCWLILDHAAVTICVLVFEETYTFGALLGFQTF